jgi:dUTP diphosphatase
MKKKSASAPFIDVDEQIRGLPEKINTILGSYPGVVYLPCYYRATAPRIFLRENCIRMIARAGDTVLNPEGRSYDLIAAGYQNLGEGIYYFEYDFLPGRSYGLELRGCLLEKQLEPGELEKELWEVCASLGIYDVLPLLRFNKIGNFGEGTIRLRIKKLDPEISLPAYAHAGDAGLDICSAEELVLQPGQRSMVSTGFAMALPVGYAAFVQPRSGLAARNGISIANTPGLIDCHYRGEVKVILINLGREPFEIKRGDRIAQMVIQRVEAARIEPSDELDQTTRGQGGFGSTGV